MLTTAWIAAHGFVAVYHYVLYRRLRIGEYLAFTVVSVGLAVYTGGSSWLLTSRSTAAAADAQRIQVVGATVTLAAFVSLLYEISGTRRRGTLYATYAWCGLGLIADLSGVFFDPAFTASMPAARFAFAPAHPEAVARAPALVFGLGAATLGVVTLVDVVREGPHDRDLRITLAAVVPVLVAGLHDGVIRRLVIRSAPFVPHLAMLTSLVISYTLMRRFTQAEDELNRRTEELRRSYEELRHVQGELVQTEQLATIGELSAVIAHELQHPLSALKEAAAALRSRNLDSVDRSHRLGILDEQSDRLNRLVRDLLAYARPIEPQREPLELREIIRRTTEQAQGNNMHTEAIELDVDLSGSPGPVHGDPDLLERAMVNVVENAIEAMPSGGVLTMRARDTDLGGTPAIALSFHDTGEGMDTLVRDKARDPFFTTRPAGTGLGLAIVDRIIRSHGGTVELHSPEGGGTTVTLTLPREPGF